MAERTGMFSSLVSELGAVGGAARDLLRSRLGSHPPRVALYGGFGSGGRMLVHGRVVEDPVPAASSAGDPAWRNAVALLRRADADPVPRAVVRVSSGTSRQEFVADDEGFFSGWMDAEGADRAGAQWVRVTGELVSTTTEPRALRGDALVLLPERPPELLVISDVDDTVLQSHATRFLEAVRTVVFQNARTRLPFPGVAAFYRALLDGPSGSAANPLFYVSSSPWNLYDVISEFLDVQRIPRGPIILRDVDLGLNVLDSRHHHLHKSAAIHQVLAAFPGARVVLIGDSGQQDPEIYRDVVREFPRRVAAVYIRNVTMTGERSRAIEALAADVHGAGTSLVLADDTLAAAQHAAEHGLIARERLDAIARDTAADEGTTPGRADAGTDAATPAPTVIVE